MSSTKASTSTAESTLAVHRCRFVDFSPSAITALAFPPPLLPSVKGKASSNPTKFTPQFAPLAVGHANGNIDLCVWTGEPGQAQSRQAWVVQQTLAGPVNSKIDSLVLAYSSPDLFDRATVPTWSDLRLFSSSGGSDLVEWDLQRKIIKRTLASQGGSIWSLAVNPASTLLAIGCEDSTVRLVSILHDTLIHLRKFDRTKSRPLSIAWGPPIPRSHKPNANVMDTDEDEDDEDEWVDSWLVTGNSDSSLRKWDFSTGRVVERMSTDKLKGERTLVWAVAVLGDGTIVSGDSMGLVKFWNSRTATQSHSFRGHGADVLCLTISPDGENVYTSGVDQKVTQFSRTAGNDSSRGWIQSNSRRLHAHDVRALAMWPSYIPVPPSHFVSPPVGIAPILISGGLDMSMTFTPATPVSATTVAKITNPLGTSAVSVFEDSYHRRLSYTTGPASTSSISLARKARLMCCRGDKGVTVWKIHPKADKQAEGDEDGTDPTSDGWEKALELDVKMQSNLIASALSDDGSWLALADAYETKLFQLTDNETDIKPRRVKQFSELIREGLSSRTTGSSALQFTPDSSRLIMTIAISSQTVVVDLNGEHLSVARTFDHHRRSKTAFKFRSTASPPALNGDVDNESASQMDVDEDDDQDTVGQVTRVAISADGQWLATSDDLYRTHVTNLDTLKHHCSLPTFRQPIHVLAFDHSTLLLGFANNTVQLFDVENRAFSSFINGAALTQNYDSILGATFEAVSSSKSALPEHTVLLWGATWIAKLKLDATGNGTLLSRKRRREQKQQRREENGGTLPNNAAAKLITKYRPILHVDFIAPGELVVVERPLVDVLAGMPPAYFKPKYGRT